MHRVRDHREKAALQLVLTLRARLDERAAALDRALDQAVVAELEVEPGNFARAAPVSTVDVLALLEAERHRHHVTRACASIARDHDERAIAEHRDRKSTRLNSSHLV